MRNNFFKGLKNLMKPLEKTPFHPQWLIKSGNNPLHDLLKNIPQDHTVLDIGCYDKWPQSVIPDSCQYIGLDYFETAQEWYMSRPDIFGDACALPVASSSVGTVLLLDVLEHIEDTDVLIQEIHRVIKKNGLFIIETPFMYPLHDEPRDFVRLTKYAYESLAKKHGFELEKIFQRGHPVETSALLSNIAFTMAIMKWASTKNPAMILVLFLPFYVLFNNLFAKLIVTFSDEETVMPFSYQVLLKKVSSDENFDPDSCHKSS
jgi:SAM-dependent methyltransferase